MIAFLRLFPQFRELQQELLEAGNARIIAEERLAQAVAERDRVWELAQAALANERLATRMVANYAVQSKYGVIPFPDAPSLPRDLAESVPATPQPSPFIRGEEIAQQRTNRFVQQWREKYKQPEQVA